MSVVVRGAHVGTGDAWGRAVRRHRQLGSTELRPVRQATTATSVLPRQRVGISKSKSIYNSAIYILCISQSAQAWITQFYLQTHHACLSFVSVRQMAPVLTEAADIQLHYSSIDPEGMKG